VKTTTRGEVFSLPVNLHTINQFFKQTFNPEEAKSFLDSLTKDFINLEPISFQDQALKFVGSELYSAFFKGYTLKQWGIAPEDLPASILKRLPLRFNYDDNYFNHQFQGIPENGYTEIFEKLIDHRNINLHLNSNVQQSDKSSFAHVFFTGPIDAWFNHKFGKLGYRTLDFESVVADGDYQGCAVMNYPEIQVPHTRITEHKHFTPWESHSKTIVFREFSRECEEGDIPYYPIRLVSEKEQLREYVNAAREELNVSFLGRLGTYRYLDMDVTINEALKSAEIFEKCIVNKVKIPVFFTDEIL
jgi:UDP-galactopyranose mutase